MPLGPYESMPAVHVATPAASLQQTTPCVCTAPHCSKHTIVARNSPSSFEAPRNTFRQQHSPCSRRHHVCALHRTATRTASLHATHRHRQRRRKAEGRQEAAARAVHELRRPPLGLALVAPLPPPAPQPTALVHHHRVLADAQQLPNLQPTLCSFCPAARR